METHTSFLSKDTFHSQLLKIIENTSEKFNKINKLFHENQYVIDKTSYHFIAQILSASNKEEKLLFNSLFNAIYQAETISGNSAYLSFVFGLTFMKHLLKHKELLNVNETDMINEFKIIWDEFKNKIENKANIINEQFLKQSIKQICEDAILSEVVWQAIKIAGLEGKIFIEEGKRIQNYIVELKEGYSFDLNPFNFLLNGKSWDRYEVKTLIIDGLVEQVSEIDQLLNKAMETKQPLLIVAHGFSEEVVATCKINNDKNNFDVMLVRLKNDISSLNVINDIGIVCGTIPVSHLLGQMISCVKWEDLPVVTKIRCNKQETVFENEKTRISVYEHIKTLLEKRLNNTLLEDVQQIIDKRIKSLVSNSVIIHLPLKDNVSNDSIRIKIDLALRNIKTLLNFGYVDFNDIIPIDPKLDSKPGTLKRIFFESLYDMRDSIEKVPTLSLAIGTLLTGKTILMLLTSSGLVVQN